MGGFSFSSFKFQTMNVYFIIRKKCDDYSFENRKLIRICSDEQSFFSINYLGLSIKITTKMNA